MGRLQQESELQISQTNDAEQSNHQSVTIAPYDQASSGAPCAASSRRPRFLSRLLWGTAFVLTATASATLGAALTLFSPWSPAIAPVGEEQQFTFNDLLRKGLRYQVTRPVNILVMGIDEVPDVPSSSSEAFAGRSDTLLLLQADPQAHQLNVLSIPRDTQVELPGMGLTKVNHANALGGPGLSARVISNSLNDVEIDRYVRINTRAFRELVDLLGGVEVFVPKPMSYVDQTQGLEIDLEQGWQTLNGEQAEQFARFRNDAYGDIGRVQRQQQLIRALRDRVASPAVLPRLPQAIEIVQKYVDTNLSLEEMLALVSFGLDLGEDDFRMVMLPGRFSQADEYIASYWLMDQDGIDQVMREYFHTSSVSLLKQHRSLNTLRVAVQNASGEPQIASEVATYLRDKGFENVYLVRDWPDQERQTQIIVQRGDLQGAGLMENVLGLGHVMAESTGDLESDLTIRVGEDWLERPGI